MYALTTKFLLTHKPWIRLFFGASCFGHGGRTRTSSRSKKTEDAHRCQHGYPDVSVGPPDHQLTLPPPGHQPAAPPIPPRPVVTLSRTPRHLVVSPQDIIRLRQAERLPRQGRTRYLLSLLRPRAVVTIVRDSADTTLRYSARL